MAAKRKAAKKKPKAPKATTAPAKAPGGPADTKVERTMQNMRCVLTDDEVVERSKAISRKLHDRAQRVEAAKAATAHLKAEIKQFDAEIGKLSQEVNDGACYRDVACEIRHVYRTGKVMTVRLDTDETVYERAMTLYERQLELPRGKPDAGAEDQEEAPDHPGADEAPESTDDGDDGADDDQDDETDADNDTGGAAAE